MNLSQNTGPVQTVANTDDTDILDGTSALVMICCNPTAPCFRFPLERRFGVSQEAKEFQMLSFEEMEHFYLIACRFHTYST